MDRYIDRQTDLFLFYYRQTDKQTNRWGDEWIDRQIYRQTDSYMLGKL